MILPPRKAPVETHEEEQKREQGRKRLRSFDEILERLKRLKAQDEIRLHHLFDDDEIHRMCGTLIIEFRDRVFTPAVTLGLFVSQVLSRGDACILSWRNSIVKERTGGCRRSPKMRLLTPKRERGCLSS